MFADWQVMWYCYQQQCSALKTSIDLSRRSHHLCSTHAADACSDVKLYLTLMSSITMYLDTALNSFYLLRMLAMTSVMGCRLMTAFVHTVVISSPVQCLRLNTNDMFSLIWIRMQKIMSLADCCCKYLVPTCITGC